MVSMLRSGCLCSCEISIHPGSDTKMTTPRQCYMGFLPVMSIHTIPSFFDPTDLFRYKMATWVFLLLSLTLCSANSDADALLAIKSQLGSSNPNLSSWVGADPCNPLWDGLTCTRNKVTTLNLTDKGLIGLFPDELGNLTNLEILDLQNNNISGPVTGSFSRLSSLKALNLSVNPIGGEFPKSILEMKSLVDLRLGACNLTGALPDAIKNMSSLQILYLNSNNFTAGVLDSLGNLPQLTELSLWGTTLNSRLPSRLGLLTNLRLLNLHDCALQGPLPDEWGGRFTKLEIMHLYNNNLTGTVPSSWSQMKYLKSLRLDSNMLTGPILQWLLSSSVSRSTMTLKCNYFYGQKPASDIIPPDQVKGNCFDDDLRDHNRQCHDVLGCNDFFAKFPRSPPPPPLLSPPPRPGPKPSHLGAIIGGVLGAVVFSILAAVLIWRYKATVNRHKFHEDTDSESEPLGNWEIPKGIEKFTLDQISKATGGFSKECEIGSGGFGKVYRASLSDGRVVAVKQAGAKSKQGHREFRNEISLLSRLHHRHLVRLLGFCYNAGHQVLVYEFMENGNLHDRLLGKHSGKPLDWYQRLEIAVGVAQGLDYLHSFADPPVIHRDLKPSNILLDGMLVAKISDFGISKVSPEFDTHVSTRPAGTAGYLDPEYFMRRQLTTASDVYGFGVVLLELVTGQKAIDHKRPDEFNLVEWVKPRLQTGGICAIVDSRLGEDFPEEAYQVLATTALKCAAFDKSERPSIKAVLNTLIRLLNGLSEAGRMSQSPRTRMYPSQQQQAVEGTTTTTTEEFSGVTSDLSFSSKNSFPLR